MTKLIVLLVALACVSFVAADCNLFCSLTRIDPGWTDSEGRSNFVWRYNLTNIGDEEINHMTVGVSDWKNSVVTSKWNLRDDPADSLMFIVTNFYLLHPGQVWEGAGFIAAGSPYLLPAFPTWTCGPHRP